MFTTNCKLLLLGLVLLVMGCAYGPTDIVKEQVWCNSCGGKTWIECEAQYVLGTCMMTECRHCGKNLAGPNDEVYMTGFSQGIRVKSFAN